ncbi:MAG: hypothetical protein LIO93_06315 [Bacteroidales bacterium]|nr:hypothetical protein [Bacteroidales bacterium]
MLKWAGRPTTKKSNLEVEEKCKKSTLMEIESQKESNMRQNNHSKVVGEDTSNLVFGQPVGVSE